MDDRKKEDTFKTEEIEGPDEEVVKEASEDSETEEEAEQESGMEEIKEDMDTESESEEPRKFFHQSQSQPEIYAGARRGKSRKKIYTVLFILGLLVLGGFLYSQRGGSEETLNLPSPTPIPTTQSSPTPVATPAFDRSEFKVRVLNGTSTQGLAASVSAKLKDLGYEIEKTANATNSAFEKTLVRVKPDLEGLVEILIKDLKGLNFESEEGPELKESDTSGAEVILGNQ